MYHKYNYLTGGINTGNYSIKSKLVVDKILNQLYGYIFSYKTLKLDKSFGINFKILSYDHAEESLRKGKLRLHVAGKTTKFIRKQKFLYDPPNGFYKNEDAFLNKCLLVCIAMGQFLNMIHEGEEQKAKLFTFSNSKPLPIKYGQEILQEIIHLEAVDPKLNEGPLDLFDVASFLSSH